MLKILETIVKYALPILIVVSFKVYSQWTETWSTTDNWTGASVDGAVKLKVSNGNVYVTGNSFHIDSGFAIMTVKYNSSGGQQWKAIYRSNSTTNAVFSNGIDVDASGNVYIVGVKTNTGNGDFLTLKYNSSGVQQWAVTYDGGGQDRGNAIAVDNSGNVYVTGGSDSAGTMNIFTIKYNSSGSQQWAWHFNKPGLSNTVGSDEAFAIALDTNTSRIGFGYGLYIVGWYDDGNNCVGPIDTLCKHDAQIVHYTFEGIVDGHRHYGCGPDNGEDWANDVVVSNVTGNLYSAGTKWCRDSTHSNYGHQFMIMKCYWDTDNDPPVFKMDYPYCGRARYFNTDVDGGNNESYSLVVENTGSGDLVYATGRSEGNGTGFDYLTIKFNVDGSPAWVSRYDSPTNESDIAYSITLNSAYIFVTGISGDPSYSDIVTIQYDKSDGSDVCIATYNGSSDIGDYGRSIGVDGSNIYVAGFTNESEAITNQSDFILLQYGESECTDSKDKISSSNMTGKYNLSQNYPNPFNPTTIINYSIPKASYVTLKIYNVLGQYVINIPSKYRESGVYSEHIDASSLASGIYFYEIFAQDVLNPKNIFKDVKKMFLLK